MYVLSGLLYSFFPCLYSFNGQFVSLQNRLYLSYHHIRIHFDCDQHSHVTRLSNHVDA